MTGLSKRWLVAGTIYMFINVGGAGFALAQGEMMHGMIHVALAVAGALAWLVVTRRRKTSLAAAQPPELDAKLEYLQQSVDAVALEIERIGEAQRYESKLRAQKKEQSQ